MIHSQKLAPYYDLRDLNNAINNYRNIKSYNNSTYKNSGFFFFFSGGVGGRGGGWGLTTQLAAFGNKIRIIECMSMYST